jgi:phosphoglycolate phosphatase
VATLASTAENPTGASPEAFMRPGFHWKAGDAYLFDIDGTLLNSRDPVHYFAFHHAVRDIFGLNAKIDGVPVHGNTDAGILRAVLRRDGFADPEIDAALPKIIEQMCAEVGRNSDQMQPEVCPSIRELLSLLHAEGKLLGTASGNLEPVGWLKLEKAGLKEMFSFGSFCFPAEKRAEIIGRGISMARKRLSSAASVYVVGDTPADIEAARSVGAPVIALATGIFKFPELMALQPDACFGCGTDMLNAR